MIATKPNPNSNVVKKQRIIMFQIKESIEKEMVDYIGEMYLLENSIKNSTPKKII